MNNAEEALTNQNESSTTADTVSDSGDPPVVDKDSPETLTGLPMRVNDLASASDRSQLGKSDTAELDDAKRERKKKKKSKKKKKTKIDGIPESRLASYGL